MRRLVPKGTVLALIIVTMAGLAPNQATAQSNDNARFARLQAQIIELEEQIRRLTGRLEESEYAQQRSEQRLNDFIGDMDIRLQGLENSDPASLANPARGLEGQNGGTQQPASPNNRTGPAIVPIEQDVLAQAAGTVTSNAEQTSQAGREGVLGTIPRDALLGLERPGNAENGAATPNAARNIHGDAETRYQAIQSLLAEGDMGSARTGLQDYLRDFPQTPQAPQASFMLGETWFLENQFADAAAQFAENYRVYGDRDPKAADNLLKLGMSLARLGDGERACTTFREFNRRYPNASPALQQMASRERVSAACP